MRRGELAHATSVMDLQASTDAAGRVATDPVEVRQRVLKRCELHGREPRRGQESADLDDIILEELHTEYVDHRKCKWLISNSVQFSSAVVSPARTHYPKTTTTTNAHTQLITQP